MSRKLKYVQVDKAKWKSYWYASKVGQVFHVIPSEENNLEWEVVTESRSGVIYETGKYISKDDCHVVEVYS